MLLLIFVNKRRATFFQHFDEKKMRKTDVTSFHHRPILKNIKIRLILDKILFHWCLSESKWKGHDLGQF